MLTLAIFMVTRVDDFDTNNDTPIRKIIYAATNFVAFTNSSVAWADPQE